MVNISNTGIEMMPEDESYDAFSAKYEKEMQAINVLFPDEKSFWTRIKVITTLRGSAPHLQDMYLAFCEWKIWDAIEKDKDVDWDELDPVKFLTSYAPSLKGRHADRAVEIARASQITAQRGVLDRLLGRE